MEQDALSTKLMEKQRTITSFMSISTNYEGVRQKRKIFTPGKVLGNQLKLSEESAEVVIERHPRSMPGTITKNSAISFVNGIKLEYGVLLGGRESPAKRHRNNFDTIQNYWVGKGRVSRTKKSISLKNATSTEDLELESETDQQLSGNLMKIKDGE